MLLVDMPSSGGGAPSDTKAALEEAVMVRLAAAACACAIRVTSGANAT